LTSDRFRHLVMEVYGYSLGGFAKRMGISRTEINRMAQGVRDVPEPLQMLLEGNSLEPAAPEYRDKRFRG